jgi:hypothetical protein
VVAGAVVATLAVELKLPEDVVVVVAGEVAVPAPAPVPVSVVDSVPLVAEVVVME